MKIFDVVQGAKVKRSAFDLSHERKLSMGMGDLVPVLCEEVVPGDKFNINTQSMVRLAPLVSPVYHRINSYIHYFFVPSRILWSGWEKFITGEEVGTVPKTLLEAISVGSLGDHMGLPIGTFNETEYINTLPFRAYFKIWNDYYRDQALQEEIDIEDQQFNDAILDAPLKKRAWEKDYFTSALPWAQKGEPVKMAAQVTYKPAELNQGGQAGMTPGEYLTVGDLVTPADTRATYMEIDNSGAGSPHLFVENLDEVTVDVNDLRQATRLQRWLERNARAGTRYVEHLLAHWGVRSKDARLQRPEYIGGGKSPVVISEVLNMTGTAEAPQGTMAGHGINVGLTNQAFKYVEEHGWIIGIMSIMPETNYMQGLHKKFSRLTNLDYYYPEFAQLGEQAVLGKEIFLDNTSGNNTTFGYQSRWAEMKYCQSSVHGLFRTTLEYWHMARKFADRPQLNATFIQSDPTTRIFAVTSDKEPCYVQLYHKITAIRPMPFLNNPTL